MKITRRDPVTGKTHTVDLPITDEQVVAYQEGALVQQAFPNLNADQREFIMTGIVPQSWAHLFNKGN